MNIVRASSLIVISLATLTIVILYFLIPKHNSNTILRDLSANANANEKLLVYLAPVDAFVPILLIDSVVLSSLSSRDDYMLFPERIKVAVNKKYLALKVAANEDTLEIIYYEKPESLDYWIFTDSDGAKRAMLPFNVTTVELYSFPAEIDTFIQDWDYSRFLECANIITRPESEKRLIPLSFADHLSKLRDFVKTSDNAHLIACGGTLLGWYRECSFIPHTTDVDFFIRSEEYSNKILKSFKSSKSPYRVFRIYGVPDDSYELAVTVRGATPKVNIDLFSLYTTPTESWMGGLDWKSRQKYKWTYPRLTELCTGDLLGSLIYVPCNVEDVLESDYGSWMNDSLSANYTWYKSARNVSPNGKFSKVQMQKMRSI